MKTRLASTSIVLASAVAAWADGEVALDVVDPAVKPVEELNTFDDSPADGRTEGAIAVTNEGSGMTTQASPNLRTLRGPTANGRVMGNSFEGTTTNVPSLDDGTVVANPKTPATAVIDGGRVQTTTRDVQAETAGADAATARNELPSADAEITVNTDAPMEAPTIERDGYATLMENELALPEIEGVDVYDVSENRIGEIGYTINSAVSGMGHPLAILEIGGFLGLGDHEVALPLPAMTFLRGDDGLRAYVDATREQLEAMPEYDG